MSLPGWRVSWDECPAQLREAVRQALDEIGIVEVPPRSNRGPQIDAWNLAAGNPLGAKWCVAFVRAMYDLADGGNPLPHTGSVSALAAWARRGGKVVHRGRLHPGDLGCIETEGPEGDEHHHIVMVVADLGDGRAACVEGNHHDGVFATIRGGAEFTTIVRAFE